MRKAKGPLHLELSLARDIKDNKKGISEYMSSKRKIRENVGSLLNQMCVLIMEDTEEVELLNASIASSLLLTLGVPDLRAFHDGMEGWIDKGRAVELVYSDFTKAFDTIFYNILHSFKYLIIRIEQNIWKGPTMAT
ncbi:hypothetical protein TURU_055675 [Turdus rufiventris]|nr:hypothetical protein TURU_055675 [Turdus rufiventris]